MNSRNKDFIFDLRTCLLSLYLGSHFREMGIMACLFLGPCYWPRNYFLYFLSNSLLFRLLFGVRTRLAQRCKILIIIFSILFLSLLLLSLSLCMLIAPPPPDAENLSIQMTCTRWRAYACISATITKTYFHSISIRQQYNEWMPYHIPTISGITIFVMCTIIHLPTYLVRNKLNVTDLWASAEWGEK